MWVLRPVRNPYNERLRWWTHEHYSEAKVRITSVPLLKQRYGQETIQRGRNTRVVVLV